VLLCLLLAGAATAAAADPALVSVTGRVEIGHGTPPTWRSARSGDAVELGDAVRTGANGRAELALGDQRVVRIYEQSLLRVGTEVTPTGAARSVALDEGKSLFDIMRKAVTDTFEVRTPEIIVSVKGTRFLVAAQPGPDFTSVFRGAVGLEGNGFDEVSVRAGFTGAQGEVLVSSFDDPWSAWESGAAAPEPSLELRRDGEVRGAIQSAREGSAGEGVAELPGKAEQVLDDAGGKSDGSDGGSNGLALGPLDPIADVARGNAKSGSEGNGNSTLLDNLLAEDAGQGGNGTPGGPGGTTDFPFTFDVTTSGGPNTVTVGFGNQSVTLDQNGVDALLSGDQNALGSLDGVVNSLGVDREALARHLDGLI
jgi:hypothetical protein